MNRAGGGRVVDEQNGGHNVVVWSVRLHAACDRVVRDEVLDRVLGIREYIFIEYIFIDYIPENTKLLFRVSIAQVPEQIVLVKLLPNRRSTTDYILLDH